MNKNRKTTKIGNDFKQLQTTIFLRTAIILIVAVVIIFIIYNGFFQGHFANAVVGFLNRFIYDDYIRLTYLIPELLKFVDEERIAFTPAVELSYLPENEQKILAEEIEYTDATPSLSQAQRLRKFSEQGKLSIDTIFAVLSEEKPNQKEQVKFKTEDIRKYFPKSYTSLDMQKTIITLLEKWQRQRERNRGEAR